MNRPLRPPLPRITPEYSEAIKIIGSKEMVYLRGQAYKEAQYDIREFPQEASEAAAVARIKALLKTPSSPGLTPAQADLVLSRVALLAYRNERAKKDKAGSRSLREALTPTPQVGE